MTRIIWFDRVDSTNSEALRGWKTLDNLSVLAAREQTAGRGQRGNSWFSAPGENLTFSLLLRFGTAPLPPLDARACPRLNLAAPVAVRDYLVAAGCPARVKWPNDLYAGRKKISGILIENGLGAAGVEYSVIGIGLNLNQRSFGNLPNATSLALETGGTFSPEAELEKLAACLERRILSVFDEEAFAALRADYTAALFQRGEARPYRNLRTGEEFTGVLEGADEDGRAVVTRCDDGTTDRFQFKELSYIL